jgi:hypothetical protein
LQVNTNVSEEHAASIFRVEDGGSMFLPRRPTSTSSPPWQPQISNSPLFLRPLSIKLNIRTRYETRINNEVLFVLFNDVVSSGYAASSDGMING